MNVSARLFWAMVTWIAASLSSWQLANAAEPEDVLPYITEDVVALAYIDIAELDIQSLMKRIYDFNRLVDDELASATEAAEAWDTQLSHLRELGLGHVFILFRTSDLLHGGPTWMLPIDADGDAREIVESLDELLAAVRDKIPRVPLPNALDVTRDFLLAGPSHERNERLAKRRGDTTPRPEASDALGQLRAHGVGLAILGDKDSRRVIREMFPKLPEPFDEIDGRLIAEGVRWVGVTLDISPRFQLQAVVQASEARNAKSIERLIERGLAVGTAWILNHMTGVTEEAPADLKKMVGLLQPRTENTVVSLRLGDTAVESAALLEFASLPIQGLLKSARRQQRINKFKQIALGMLNHESARRSYPPAAIVDERGKPLLSWRVAILPYLEEQALYDQFRLDEPWDSDHNRQLIAQKPDIYADPDPTVRRRIGGEGRTTFVVPTGELTVFSGKEGTTIKQITDGTSATVLGLEVVPERAVIWSKPDEWEVDFEQPFNGVRRNDGRPITIMMCDGSARLIDPRDERDVANWPRMLTSAAGELIEW